MEKKKKTAPNKETEVNTDLINAGDTIHKEEPELGSLESLLYDSEDDILPPENPDEGVSYEEFLSEYHQVLSKTLSVKKEEHINNSSDTEESKAEDEDDESDILIALPENKSSKTRFYDIANGAKLWDKDVSMSTDLPSESETESDILLSEAEAMKADNDNTSDSTEFITYSEDDEDFQLSFTFEDKDDFFESENDEEDDEEYFNDNRPRIIDWIFEIVEMLVFTFVAVIILTTFVFKHSVVEGDSMLNTLENGDHLIISDLFYTPERNDIIVFEDYSTSLKKAVVKRVIAIPGDTVNIVIDGRDMHVFVNGEEIEEDFAHYDPYSTPYGSGSWIVGENEVFVMGDNRFNSTDSRSAGVGPVNIDSILGEVLFRFYPFDKFGGVN